jgi:uroporphyrinogen-III synthase
MVSFDAIWPMVLLLVCHSQVTSHQRANNGIPMTPVLILTRPTAQADAFADMITARWAGALRLITSPLLQIVMHPLAPDPGPVAGVILTSAHGVAAAAKAGLPANLPAYCVGEKTADLARAAGFAAITGPGDATRLAEKIIARRPKGPLLHLRGQHSRGNLAERLNAAGIPCRDIVAYDQIAQMLNANALAALNGDAPVVLPLFSPRTATILTEQMPFSAALHLVVISAAVQSAAAAIRAKSVSVAAAPDASAMVEATLKRLVALTAAQ